MKLRSFIFLLPIFISLSTQAGVVIGGTRFVYPEKEPSISVGVKNTSAQVFLVQSKTTASEGKNAFITTPPIFSVAPGHANKIRIVRTSDNLPTDRESLFYLTISAIPEGKPVGNSLQIAVKSRMKLFYRPASLTKDAGRAYQQLQWITTEKGLQVKNPGPYYVTISQLKLNQQLITQSLMIAPFSSLFVDGCRKNLPCQIHWQSFNDYAVLMPVCEIILDRDYSHPIQCSSRN